MVLAVDVGDSLQRALDRFFAFLPGLLGALVILIVGYIVAKLVAGLVARGLAAVGTDRALETGAAGSYKERFAPNLQPSGLIGTIAFWFVFGAAILLAVSALGIEALTDAIEGVVAYLPNIIAAILILLVATALAGAVGELAERLAGGTMLGRLVQTAVPILIMTIAVFMALDQLKIAEDIVVWTYVLVLGSIALGFALAFGLGGRDIARQILLSAYEGGRARVPELKADARQAKEQAASDMEAIKEKAPEGASPQSGASARTADGA